MLQEDSAYRQFTTDYRNWCWYSSVSSIASNHGLSSLCYRRIQHTDNLPLIIGIGVGIPVCLLLLVIMIYLLIHTRKSNKEKRKHKRHHREELKR